MLTLVLVLVGFVVSMLYGLFGLGFSVTLPSGETMDNASSLDATVSIFQDAVDTLVNSDILGYVAYFLPVSGLYVLTEVFFTCIVIYTVVSSLYQIITDWVVSRSS